MKILIREKRQTLKRSSPKLRPRFLPPSQEHRFISLNLPLFGHQLCNNAKGGWEGDKSARKKIQEKQNKNKPSHGP